MVKSMSTPWKACMRSRGIAPLIFNLDSRWKWLVVLTRGPIYSWERTFVQIEYGAGLTQGSVWEFWKKCKLLIPAGVRTPDLPARISTRVDNDFGEKLNFCRIIGNSL